MKILHINTKNHSGGAALVARNLHLEQRKQGIDSTFIAGRGEQEDSQQLITLTQSRSRFLLNVLGFRTSQREAPLNQKLWAALWAKYIEPADLIHLHNAHGYYLPHSVLTRLLNKPTVWTLHDNWLLSGRCSFSHDCDRYKTGCTSCPLKNYYPKTWIDHAAKEFINRRALPLDHCQLVTPSQTQKEHFLDAGFSNEKIQVIANPITLASTRYSPEDKAPFRQQLGLDPHRYTLLFAAEFLEEPRKGFDVVRKLIPLLPDPERYQIILIGQTKQPALLPIKTHHAGLITSREKMAHLFALSDLTIIPSREESFGLIGPEALACGSQVICNDLPVFRECMNNEALFISDNDPEIYAKTIDGESRKKDRLSTPPSSSASAAAQQYIALYQRLLGR